MVSLDRVGLKFGAQEAVPGMSVVIVLLLAVPRRGRGSPVVQPRQTPSLARQSPRAPVGPRAEGLGNAVPVESRFAVIADVSDLDLGSGHRSAGTTRDFRAAPT